MKSLTFAHRGFSGKHVENTMDAFQAAYEAEADGIELDVQLTRDGEVVIFHDATLDRLTNATGWIAEWTAEELSHVRMPSTLGGQHKVHRIPTFKEYVEWACEKDLLTNVEIKSVTSEDYGLEKKVLDLVHDYGLEEKVLISSFHKNALMRVKELNPTMECGLLTSGCNAKILRLTKSLGVEYIHPHYTSLTEELVEEAERLGLEMNVWTANEPQDIDLLLKMEPMGIITDYPDRVRDSQIPEVLAFA